MSSPTDTSADRSALQARAGARHKLGHMAPILVVEDNYLAAADLMRLLEEWDVPTRCAGQAAAARALAREMRPKLALVDINLADGFEGIELALELQSLYRTKVVFVTAYHVLDVMHRLVGAENMAVLFKPVQPDVLATVLDQVAAAADVANQFSHRRLR